MSNVKVQIGSQYEPAWFEHRSTSGTYSAKLQELSDDAITIQSALLNERTQPEVRMSPIAAFLIAAAAMLGMTNASATEPDTLYLTAPVGSYHFDRKHDYNENNYGAGVEYNGWIAGGFRNSFDKNTVYGGYAWRPVKAGPVSAGVAVAAATGYDMPVIAYATVAVERKGYGVELIATPPVSGTNHKGMIGLQLRMALGR